MDVKTQNTKRKLKTMKNNNNNTNKNNNNIIIIIIIIMTITYITKIVHCSVLDPLS